MHSAVVFTVALLAAANAVNFLKGKESAPVDTMPFLPAEEQSGTIEDEPGDALVEQEEAEPERSIENLDSEESAMGDASVDPGLDSADATVGVKMDESANADVEMDVPTEDLAADGDIAADDASSNAHDELESVNSDVSEAPEDVAAIDDSSEPIDGLSGDEEPLAKSQIPPIPTLTKNATFSPMAMTANGGVSVQSADSTLVSAQHQKLLAAADVTELKRHILSNPAFQQKVQNVCKQHPETNNCENATTDAVMCQLLWAAKPEAAKQACLPSAGSLLQRRSEALEQKLATAVIHDLYAHFDKLGLIDSPAMKSGPQQSLAKIHLAQGTADASQDVESDADGQVLEDSADIDVAADDDGDSAVGDDGEDGIDDETPVDDGGASAEVMDTEEDELSVDDSEDDVASLSEASPSSTDPSDMLSDAYAASNELFGDADVESQPVVGEIADPSSVSEMVLTMGKSIGSMDAAFSMHHRPDATHLVAHAHAASVTVVDASNTSEMTAALKILTSDKPHLAIQFAHASPDVLKQQIFANAMFKQKVNAYCANFPSWHLCEEITGVVMYCQLLQKAKHAEAPQLCAHDSKDDATHLVANAHAASVSVVDASNASAMASAMDALTSDKPHLVIQFANASPDVVKQQIFANAMFKQKVNAYCASFPVWHLCEEITGVVMYCQLLQKAKPAEAPQLCSHDSNSTKAVF